jgi:hypothetical protein
LAFADGLDGEREWAIKDCRNRSRHLESAAAGGRADPQGCPPKLMLGARIVAVRSAPETVRERLLPEPEVSRSRGFGPFSFYRRRGLQLERCWSCLRDDRVAVAKQQPTIAVAL